MLGLGLASAHLVSGALVRGRALQLRAVLSRINTPCRGRRSHGSGDALLHGQHLGGRYRGDIGEIKARYRRDIGAPARPAPWLGLGLGLGLGLELGLG